MSYSLLKISRRFREHFAAKLAAWFLLVPCFSYSSTLKVEAIYSSETSIDFQRTTRRYIPECWTLQMFQGCDNCLLETKENVKPLIPLLYPSIVYTFLVSIYNNNHYKMDTRGNTKFKNWVSKEYVLCFSNRINCKVYLCLIN
jgi:hypothetical protein